MARRDGRECEFLGVVRQVPGRRKGRRMNSAAESELPLNAGRLSRATVGERAEATEDVANQPADFSPTPAYSDKFGKLKKSEALEILFKNLNRQLRAMKVYFSKELEVVASLEANEDKDDKSECHEKELRRYVE